MTFDANGVLEKTSVYMERMTVLMDKMYIKLEQKYVPNNVSNVESMTTWPMNVLIWFLIIQIGKVTVQEQCHYIWWIVIQDRIWSNI